MVSEGARSFGAMIAISRSADSFLSTEAVDPERMKVM
jgi:hypothetical protein